MDGTDEARIVDHATICDVESHSLVNDPLRCAWSLGARAYTELLDTAEGCGMGHGMALDQLPATVLYDVFQDAAAVLTGLYLERQRHATDLADAASWWDKVVVVRDQFRATDPDDRARIVEHVTRWQREAVELNTC